MKIKGWEKISGITYKGCTIVNPMHNADETRYEATILDLNHPQKPKWELKVLTPSHKWKHKDDLTFNISLCDDNKVSSHMAVSKQQIQTLSGFRMLYEDLIEKILHLRLQNTLFKTINGGISSIDYGKSMGEMMKSIKELNNL